MTHHTPDTTVALPDASEEFVALLVPPALRPHLWAWLGQQRCLLPLRISDVPELDGFPVFIPAPPEDERVA